MKYGYMRPILPSLKRMGIRLYIGKGNQLNRKLYLKYRDNKRIRIGKGA